MSIFENYFLFTEKKMSTKVNLFILYNIRKQSEVVKKKYSCKMYSLQNPDLVFAVEFCV